jgi:hypothetical protein
MCGEFAGVASRAEDRAVAIARGQVDADGDVAQVPVAQSAVPVGVRVLERRIPMTRVTLPAGVS